MIITGVIQYDRPNQTTLATPVGTTTYTIATEMCATCTALGLQILLVLPTAPHRPSIVTPIITPNVVVASHHARSDVVVNRRGLASVWRVVAPRRGAHDRVDSARLGLRRVLVQGTTYSKPLRLTSPRRIALAGSIFARVVLQLPHLRGRLLDRRRGHVQGHRYIWDSRANGFAVDAANSQRRRRAFDRADGCSEPPAVAAPDRVSDDAPTSVPSAAPMPAPTPGPTTPALLMVEPNEDSRWVIGETRTVSWRYSGALATNEPRHPEAL